MSFWLTFTIFLFSLIIIIFIYFLLPSNKKEWKNKPEVFIPFIISLIVTLIIFSITLSMAIGSDKKIDNLNDKIDLFIEGTITFNKNIEEPIPLLKNVITLNESLSKNGSILLWVSLNKPKEIYPKVYILDIGDSLIKNRMSLFIDEYGFLNWRIIDSSLVEHTLKTDINRFLNGTKFMITATWNNDGNLNLYVNNLKPIHNRLDYFDLKIESKELYLYSDIHGDYKIKPIHN